MAINFPNSPTEGQVHSTGTANYTYKNGVWERALKGTALPFNYLVNSSMQVSQQNGDTGGTASGFYPADQWVSAVITPTTAQRVVSRTPRGSNYRMRVTVNTALATPSSAAYIYQALEGNRIAAFRFGTASAKQLIFRFGFRGPAGTYCVALRNGPSSYRSYPAQFIISAGQANTDTEQTFIIPGDTAGTWAIDNSSAMYVFVTYAANATYQGTPNMWQDGSLIATPAISNGVAVAGNVFELFDAGLYLDPDSTYVAPPWEPVDAGRAHYDATRYWYRVQSCRGVSSQSLSHSRAGCNFMSEMRTGPAYTIIGGVYAWDQAGSTPVTGMTPYSNPYYCEMEQTLGVTLTAGRSCFNPPSSAFDVYIAANAR